MIVVGLVAGCADEHDTPDIAPTSTGAATTSAGTPAPAPVTSTTGSPAPAPAGADCSGESPTDPCVPAATEPIVTLPRCEDPDDVTDPDEAPCQP